MNSLKFKAQTLVSLLIRITLGVVFVQSGWGKVHNLEKVIGFFTSLHLPAPEFQAHLVAYSELFFGALVLVGFLTRLSSIPLLITMVVALVTAKASDISEFSDVFGLSEFLYVVLFLVLIVEGAGLLSVDALFSKAFNVKSKLIA